MWGELPNRGVTKKRVVVFLKAIDTPMHTKKCNVVYHAAVVVSKIKMQWLVYLFSNTLGKVILYFIKMVMMK